MNNIFVISFNCFLFFYSFRHSFLSSVHSFRHFVIHFVRHFVAREESKVLVDWWSKKKNKKAETCWKERWKDYIAQQSATKAACLAPSLSVEERVGKYTRCEDNWCRVAQFCDQHGGNENGN